MSKKKRSALHTPPSEQKKTTMVDSTPLLPPTPEPSPRPNRRSRDQERAIHAYRAVEEITEPAKRDAFKRIARRFGADVLRLGLAAALAVLERDNGGQGYLKALATAQITYWPGDSAKKFPAWVRNLEKATEYMLVTREVLKIAQWLKRAAEASFDEGQTNAQPNP
jgi:CRISPR/Cas system CMR-associated protein Cmr5 small subunit